MDLRKLKKLIDLVEESGITELEVTFIWQNDTLTVETTADSAELAA